MTSCDIIISTSSLPHHRHHHKHHDRHHRKFVLLGRLDSSLSFTKFYPLFSSGEKNYVDCHFQRGHAVAQLVETLRYKQECRGYTLTESFRPHYGPGVDSASNRNGYRE